MIFKKLKLKGFKSFVEPTELLIEKGLTGIVGPNGCGKSNLVEALRFVMGELSPKQMRGSELDDVIFNGTNNRSAWDIAEVSIEINNENRKAPKNFNDRDEIQVTRRIWRGEGSEYKVNGKDVRLRDVQLLFADAATGARSTSIVSQGRVGALITAKPEQRRALLEEAAGITGLHTRRHEAELRLNSSSNNLDRIKDVLTEQETQLSSLKRQSKQAVRYKNIQDDIKRAEAALFYYKWSDIQNKIKDDNQKLYNQEKLVNDQTQEVAKINIKFEEHQNKIPNLRLKDNSISAELQKFEIMLNNYGKEIEQINSTKNDLEIRVKQIDDDIRREEVLSNNARVNLEKITEERKKLSRQGDLFPENNIKETTLENNISNPIIDYIDFEEGLESAIASVFRDDLIASINENEPNHWKKFNEPEEKSIFPDNIVPLIKLVKAPENLHKKLMYIGLVKNKENIDKIHRSLKPGQVLVSENGEVWRWDGFTSNGKQNSSIKAVVEQLKNRRIKELLKEEGSWQKILHEANNRVLELQERKKDIGKQLEKLRLKPEDISKEKLKLSNMINETKKTKEETSSNLHAAEKEANEINKNLKLQEIKLTDFREEKIRIEGIISTHNEAENQIKERIKEKLNCEPKDLPEIGEINISEIPPSVEELDNKLEKLIQERERLGGVNLLAEQEALELEEKVNLLRNDRDDLLKAIAKLREGIAHLNKEGRQRLLAAYGVVNENFQKLFLELFNGGKAYLKLSDDVDPLESGLEVFASPPGKKLQNLSLLSGGEQALTALALLFAVFLSNPSPICVLDEVDAALDDTNVDRFCSLVEEITKTSSTKFLLITHHRMTMSRVNRLFGVTMPEQGISQLVSVELEEAEKIREKNNG